MTFREAAGFEGLIVIAIIYFIMSQVQRAGKRLGQSRPAPQPPAETEPTPTEREGLSLAAVLREVERVQRQAQAARTEAARRPPPPMRPAPTALPDRRPPPPWRAQTVQDERGPLGRPSRTRLPSAEEPSLEEGSSLESAEVLEALGRERRSRRPVDFDEEAEAVVRKRQQAVDARDVPHQSAAIAASGQQARSARPAATGAFSLTGDRLKEAIVWREILGPPKAWEE